MSENDELKDSFKDTIEELRKKRGFEYQRVDSDGNRTGGFYLDWNRDTQIWMLTSCSAPGTIPREFSRTTPEEWDTFFEILGTTDMKQWQDLPKDEDDNQVNRVWLFNTSASMEYFGVGIDHRLATVRKIAPGLAKIAELIKACDIHADGHEAVEADDPTLEDLGRITELRPQASSGDLEAQAELGARLIGAPVQHRNFDEGMKWLMEAAKSGGSSIEFNIGTSFLLGYSGKADLKSAYLWLEKAAAKKHLGAMRNIGLMTMNGSGCPKNEALGYDYMLRASKMGDYPSLLNIGQLFLDGTYVKKDPQEAAAWFILSHKMGAVEAVAKLQSLKAHFDEDELEGVVAKAEARIPSLCAELNK